MPKIHSTDYKVEKLFTDNFIVPRYQREFSWDLDQVTQLWSDIDENIEARRDDYFLGQIVIKKDGEHYDIIDGQQRLATLTILFAAIRDKYLAVSEKDHADRIQKHYIADKNIELHLIPKLTLNLQNKDFFFRYIVDERNIDKESMYSKKKKLRKTSKLIYNAYASFYKSVDEKTKDFEKNQLVEYLKRLEKCIINIVVIRTLVEDESDAFLIFETLNDRGLDLSTTDLLKNHLFSLAEDRLEDVQQKWEEMASLLNEVNINSFLRHFWISFKEPIRQKFLYAELKNHLKKEDTVNFITNLKREAEVYYYFIRPDKEYWKDDEIVNMLEDLSQLSIKQCFSLLLSCKRADYTNKDFKTVLRLCINFSFRYSTICNKNPNILERRYSEIARNVHNKLITIEGIKSELAKDNPTDEQVKAAFIEKDVKDKAVIRYILTTINNSKTKEQAIGVKGTKQVHIEHILPQIPDSEWEEYLKKKKLDYKELVYKIGNLTLLGREYNQQIKNFFITKKVAMYKQSLLPINETLKELTEWDDKTIEARQKALAEDALKIWSFD